MMEKANNLKIIERLYGLFREKDNNSIRNLMHEDIVWQQMEGFPNGGVYSGSDAIFKEVFGTFSRDWKNWIVTIAEYIDAGNCIIVLGSYEGTFLLTNQPMKANFAHFYYLENEKIKKFVQYTDTALIAKAMGLILEKK